jgi:hypothetical protein
MSDSEPVRDDTREQLRSVQQCSKLEMVTMTPKLENNAKYTVTQFWQNGTRFSFGPMGVSQRCCGRKLTILRIDGRGTDWGTCLTRPTRKPPTGTGLQRCGETILRKSCGFRTTGLRFAHIPAVGRTTVTSPFLMKSFETLNTGKSYAEQIKPFNFLLPRK